MHFEWDSKKAATNQRKHGVTFEEASSALRDSFSATAHDPDHSENEKRFVTFGIFFPRTPACGITHRKGQCDSHHIGTTGNKFGEANL
jgi:uncharacterized DUF497 family protein